MSKYTVAIPAALIRVEADNYSDACFEAEEIAGEGRNYWTVIDFNEESEIICPQCGAAGTIVRITHDVTIKQYVVGKTVISDLIEIVPKGGPTEGFYMCDKCKTEIDLEEVVSVV